MEFGLLNLLWWDDIRGFSICEFCQGDHSDYNRALFGISWSPEKKVLYIDILWMVIKIEINR
jgi:hypothetical protein